MSLQAQYAWPANSIRSDSGNPDSNRGYRNCAASKNTNEACQLIAISLLAYEANWSA